MTSPAQLRRQLESRFRRPIFAILNAAAHTSGLSRLRTGEAPRLGPARQKLLRIWYRIGYDVRFLQLRLADAAGFRVRYLLAIAHGVLPGDAAAACRYLWVISEPDVVDFVTLDDHHRTLLEQAAQRRHGGMLHPSRGSRRELGRVLLFGPAADPADADLDAYDTLAFTKPPPASLGVRPERIVLTLNNYWPLQKSEELRRWLMQHRGALVLSPQRVGEHLEPALVFQDIPQFLLEASLMGLQRALFILIREFQFDRIDVIGFDFALSPQPYGPWYPSMIKSHWGDLRRGILQSNRIHDFVLNLMFVRKLVREYPQIQGPIRDISQRDFAVNAEIFSELYG